MENFKVVADTLASVAAFIAIVSVLVSWYRGARKPLVIERIVIHRKKEETTYILYVKNIKDYPVEIKRIECYKRKNYTVQKKPGQKPEYSEGLPLSERVFSDKTGFQIGANGHTDIRIRAGDPGTLPNKLLFSIATSHGYHEIWCSDILIVPIGEVDVYSLDYELNPKSKLGAKFVYWGAVLKELPRSCSRRLRRS